MLPHRFFPPLGAGKVSSKQRTVAQWRGVDLAPEEKAQTNRARQVARVMPGVLSGLRLDRRRAEAEVMKVWQQLMDPCIVAHAQPVGLNKGTLFVAVDSNVWLSEIVQYHRKEILNRLQHSFSREMIARISFRLG
jgi:hypothetical protein